METLSGNLQNQCITKMKLHFPLETQILYYSNRKALLALLTRILNIHFQKESEWKSSIVINILTFQWLFQLPSVFLSIFLRCSNSSKRHLWHSYTRTNISFHFLFPKPMPVCKQNKESHATLAIYFRKYYPVCPTVMIAHPEVFFLRITITMNILCKDH